MSSKYAALPDIDTSNPDVYETPDVPTSFSFGHDSDSDSEYNNNEHGLITPSGSNGLLSARSNNHGSSSSDEAGIVKSHLKPADARDLFAKRKGASNGNSRSSLLPESSTYSVKNATRHNKLSNTAKRQLRHKHLLEDGDVDYEDDEPETPTERLRRLRYEAEELEMQIEAEVAAKKGKGKASNEDVEESSEYEQIDDLPKRDDADKTKPPPSRRRRKKSTIDENGELSPAILLQQIKKIRGNLSAVELVEEDGDYSADPSNSHAVEARTKDLLRKLSNIKGQAITTSGALEADKQGGAKGSDSVPASQTSLFDSRLEVLEKFIGTNEADLDEARPLPPPLLSTLAKLEHQLQLLTQPRHLDAISRRVKTLVTDLERVHEARRKIGDTRPLNIALSSGITVATGSPGTLLPSTPGQGHSPLPASSASPGGTAAGSISDVQLPPDTLQKIDGLFQILPRIDPLIPLAPHLLTRLRSLATLHEASTTFSNDLKDGEHAIESLKQSEAFMKQLLEGLQESMGTNQDVMKSNLEGLQNRIDKVMDRLERLQ